MLYVSRVCLLMLLVNLAFSPVVAQAGKLAAGKQQDPRALYEAGMLLLEQQETYRAVDAFMTAVSINPAYGDAWAALARCQYELGEYERAVLYLGNAYKYGPRTTELVTLHGFSLIGLGKLTEARTYFEEALAKLPNDRDARFGLALLDVRSGRPADAKARLSLSLKSAPRDPRALLSLALISRAEGRSEESAAYLSEALRWTSGDADASYAAASLFAENGDFVEAARLARAAIELVPTHPAARGLLASLYYEQGKFDDARFILEGSISYDRNDLQAWFLLGLVEAASGRQSEAEYALSTLTALRADDELARIALENLAMEGTGFEDPSRAALAAWRFERAADFEASLLYEKALAEYRRGLSVDPYSNKGRRRYAELLRSSGLPASYLSELRFLADLGKSDQALSDAIEIYDSLLEGSVSRDWGLEGSSIDTVPYRVAVYSVGPGGTPYHAGSDMVVARYLRDSLAFEPGIDPERGVPRVPSFADAYRLARDSGVDWFILVGVAENERDIIISAELRAARTGALAVRIEAPRSGNDRVALAIGRVIRELHAALPLRGIILERKANAALLALGRINGVVVGDSFLVLKSGSVSIRPDASGLLWNEADIVARFMVTRVDDEVSEGTLERVGFFDRVNPRDTVIREPPKPTVAADPKAATAGSAPVETISEPAVSSQEWSTLFDRVRRLY
jgi:tetratricopeptide (TPR) repeat protein